MDASKYFYTTEDYIKVNDRNDRYSVTYSKEKVEEFIAEGFTHMNPTKEN